MTCAGCERAGHAITALRAEIRRLKRPKKAKLSYKKLEKYPAVPSVQPPSRFRVPAGFQASVPLERPAEEGGSPRSFTIDSISDVYYEAARPSAPAGPVNSEPGFIDWQVWRNSRSLPRTIRLQRTNLVVSSNNLYEVTGFEIVNNRWEPVLSLIRPENLHTGRTFSDVRPFLREGQYVDIDPTTPFDTLEGDQQRMIYKAVESTSIPGTYMWNIRYFGLEAPPAVRE